MMNSDPAFHALLNGDPAPLAVKNIVIEDSLEGSAVACLRGVGLEGKLALVSDRHTWEALADRVRRELAGMVTDIVTFRDPPKASEEVALTLMEHTAPASALVAVGSGTLNDLVKYAAHKAGKPYAVFPTAPSMNGYLSASASLESGGIKRSLEARMPAGVFCDLGVIANAPPRLIRSGLGDSAARPTAQADWLLSHRLLGTPYSSLPFDLLLPHEDKLFSRAEGLTRGDKETTRLLMRVLLLSGIGMTLCGGSYPASQGEHMIAHAMEGFETQPSYHGEQIAVTSLAMAARQERRLAGLPALQTDVPLAALIKLFGEGKVREYVRASAGKLISLQALAREKVEAAWPALVKEIRSIHIPEIKLQETLQAAGCPILPEEIGWPAETFQDVAACARLTRDRFTFLDLE